MNESEIVKFIETFAVSHHATVNAAVLFGSALYKDEREVDDIDIFIVLAEDKVFRGNFYLSSGSRIDYFTGSLRLIEEQFTSCRGTTDSLPFYVFGEGRVLFGETHISHLIDSAKEYLANFPGYENKETLLKVLWYKLTDAYDDYIKTEDQVVKNLVMAEIITTSMEFYCVYHDELVKKNGTSDRGEFSALYSALLSDTKQEEFVQALLTFLSKESGFSLHKDWEVQFR